MKKKEDEKKRLEPGEMNYKRLNEAMKEKKIPSNKRIWLFKVFRQYDKELTVKQRKEVNKNLEKYKEVFEKYLNPVQAGLINTYWKTKANDPKITHLQLILELEGLPYVLMAPPIKYRNPYKAIKIQKEIRDIMEAN